MPRPGTMRNKQDSIPILKKEAVSFFLDDLNIHQNRCRSGRSRLFLRGRLLFSAHLFFLHEWRKQIRIYQKQLSGTGGRTGRSAGSYEGPAGGNAFPPPVFPGRGSASKAAPPSFPHPPAAAVYDRKYYRLSQKPDAHCFSFFERIKGLSAATPVIFGKKLKRRVRHAP